jgi:hypothetical protein
MRSILPLFAAAFAIAAPALAQQSVPLPGFRSVQLLGGGEVTVRPGPVQRVTLLEGSTEFTHFTVLPNGKLRIDVCDERCPRHYRLRVDIQSPRVPDLAIDGGGSLQVAGGFAPQPTLSAAVNGGGALDARAVEAGNVSAAVNGGGALDVRARFQLSAAVIGGGAIRYSGNPQVSMAVRGGGAVTRE